MEMSHSVYLLVSQDLMSHQDSQRYPARSKPQAARAQTLRRWSTQRHRKAALRALNSIVESILIEEHAIIAVWGSLVRTAAPKSELVFSSCTVHLQHSPRTALCLVRWSTHTRCNNSKCRSLRRGSSASSCTSTRNDSLEGAEAATRPTADSDTAGLLHRTQTPIWIADNPYIINGFRPPRPSV